MPNPVAQSPTRRSPRNHTPNEQPRAVLPFPLERPRKPRQPDVLPPANPNPRFEQPPERPRRSNKPPPAPRFERAPKRSASPRKGQQTPKPTPRFERPPEHPKPHVLLPAPHFERSPERTASPRKQAPTLTATPASPKKESNHPLPQHGALRRSPNRDVAPWPSDNTLLETIRTQGYYWRPNPNYRPEPMLPSDVRSESGDTEVADDEAPARDVEVRVVENQEAEAPVTGVKPVSDMLHLIIVSTSYSHSTAY